jgi:hypothetical protein
MSVNNIVRAIVMGKKLSDSPLTLLFEFLTSVESGKHDFVADLKGYIRRPVLISIVSLEHFRLEEVILGFGDVFM